MRSHTRHQSNDEMNRRRNQKPYLPEPSAARLSVQTARGSSRRGRPAGAARIGLLLCLTVSLLILAWNPSGLDAAPQAQANADVSVPDVGPIADWGDDMLELVADLLRILAEAKYIIDNLGGEGPLSGSDLTGVQQSLDAAEGIIDQIFDPYQYPSLIPIDAGTVDTSLNPSTLGDYAADCVTCAEEARDAVTPFHVADVTIGSKLKTIQALLPDYRLEAGISG